MKEQLKQGIGYFIPWAGVLLLLYGMTCLQVPMGIKNIFLVVTTSAFLFYLWKKERTEKWEMIILMLGLFARVAFCYVNVFGGAELPIGGSNDGIGFMETAIAYYYGDFSVQYTRYPYILWGIFQIMGINQFAAQYVNILCWGFAALILQKSCKRLEIEGKLRLIAIAVFAWLPTNIWITSILYRDAYIILLLFLSFYFLIRWMQECKWWQVMMSVLAVFLATLLHGASIMALLPVLFVLVFYSREKKQFQIDRKSLIIVGTMLGLVIILFVIPQTRETILRKLPSMEGGLVVGLNRYLANKYDGSVAGSDYLTGRYLAGYWDIPIMTIERMYYHILSPVPHLWRGIVDAAAFLLGSAPVYLIAVLLWIVSIFYKKKDVYRLVLFLEVFITVGVYAWGNKNAGSALRHREKILSLVLLLGLYSLNIILIKRKERKSNEK